MANLKETSTWEAGIYQLETSDPVMGGENGIDNRAPRQLANRTLWLKNELARQIGLVNQANTNLTNQKADKTVQITAGNGLTGGGNLSSSRTLALGTPSKITANSINTAVSNTHSHAIDKASTTVAGIVQLNDTLTSTATNQALTAAQGKALNDRIASNTRSVNERIPNSKKSDAVNSSSSDTVATSKAVKTAYDLANAAFKVDSSNQNQNLNNLLGQNTVFGTARIDSSITGLDGIYNYGAGIVFSAAGARCMIYMPHSTQDSNRGVWAQSSFYGNAALPYWRRIDGADWPEVRNKPTTLEGYSTVINRPDAHLLGRRDNQNKWVVGLQNQTSDDVALHSYTHSTSLKLKEDRVEMSKAPYFNNYEVWHKGNLPPIYQQDHRALIPNTQITYQSATPEQLPVGTFLGLTTNVVDSGRNGWQITSKNWEYPSGYYSTVRLGINENKLYFQQARNYQEWNTLKQVVTHDEITVQQLYERNLNDISVPGLYGQNLNNNATQARNYPEQQAGSLLVTPSAYGVQQEYTTYSTNRKYVRGRQDNAWGEWKRIDGADWSEVRNKPTASTTQAGITQLNSEVNSDLETQSATPKAVKIAYDKAVDVEQQLNQLHSALQIQRKDYSARLTPTHNNFRTQTVNITGSVEVLPDGRIIQRFTFSCPVIYFHRYGLSAFYREKLGVTGFAADNSPLLELPLWTAMPNKVQEARIHLSANLNHNAWGEALEWIYDWDSIFNQHANIKDKAYFAFRRVAGGSDESVTFNIVVEGY